MRLLRIIGASALCVATASASDVSASEPPGVVASIRPVHSLAAGVMGDVGTPELIVSGYGSPHVYQMRPSEARALAGADIVLWVGEALETFLAGPIRNLSGGARVVSLLEADGLDLHPARTSSPWDGGYDHDSEIVSPDPHVWLAPENAKAMVEAIVLVLSEADPERAAAYVANGEAVKSRIDTLRANIENSLSDVAAVPFVTFHDSMQYFESAFGLNSVGAVTIAPDRQPGAGSIRALRQRMSDNGVACVAVEPQFRPVLLGTLEAGGALARAEIDPIGTFAPAAADSYFEMMTSNSDNLARCLNARQR